jgi:hypothetical protein
VHKITIRRRSGQNYRIVRCPKSCISKFKCCNLVHVCEQWFQFMNQGKVKGKGHLLTGHEVPDVEQRYSSTLSLNSALDGVGGQRHAPAALPPRKTRYPLYRRLSGPQGRSGLCGKSRPPLGFDPRNVQPVASRYTDCALPVSLWIKSTKIFFRVFGEILQWKPLLFNYRLSSNSNPSVCCWWKHSLLHPRLLCNYALKWGCFLSWRGNSTRVLNPVMTFYLFIEWRNQFFLRTCLADKNEDYIFCK